MEMLYLTVIKLLKVLAFLGGEGEERSERERKTEKWNKTELQILQFKAVLISSSETHHPGFGSSIDS